MGFVENFIRFSAVQTVCKSAKIRQSYREFKSGNFLRHSVRRTHETRENKKEYVAPHCTSPGG